MKCVLNRLKASRPVTTITVFTLSVMEKNNMVVIIITIIIIIIM